MKKDKSENISIHKKKRGTLSGYQINFLWLAVERGSKVLFSIFATFFVARYLGTEKFGALSYVHSLTLLLMALATFGLDNILVRELASNPESSRSIFYKSFLIKLTLTLIFIISSFLLSGRLSLSSLEKELFFPFILVLLFSTFNLVEFYLLAFTKSHIGVKAAIVSGVVANIFKILCVHFDLGILYIAYCFAFEAILLALIYLVAFYKNAPLDKQKSALKTTDLIKSCLPLMVASVSTILYMRMDQLMLRHMLGLEEVGKYSAAVKIGEFGYFIPVIFTGTYFSKWIVDYKDSKDLESFSKSTSFLMLIAWFIIIIIFLFSNMIIQEIYGKEFAESASILRIHIFSTLFVFIGTALAKLLIMFKLEKILLWSSVLGGLINLILNYFFIPKWGGDGAALATVLSQGVASLLFIFVLKETKHLRSLVLRSLIPGLQILDLRKKL